MPAEDPTRTREAPEAFWLSIEEEVKQRIISVYQYYLDRLVKRGRSPEDIQEYKDVYLAREKAFVMAVMEKVQNALERAPEDTIVLFDIDETIGDTPEGEDGKRKDATVLRPAIIPLLGKIQSLDVRMGTLTYRGSEPLKRQFVHDEHLADVNGYMDDDLIFVTSSVPIPDADKFIEKVKAEYMGPQGILSDEALGKENMLKNVPPIQQKLIRLAEIRKAKPDASIVVVDDLEYTTFLNEAGGVYGVYLPMRGDNGSKFFLPQ